MASSHQEVDRVILPTNVKPELYRLQVEPDLEKFIFHGEVEIDFALQERTKIVQMNAKELKIHEALLRSGASGEWIKAKEIRYDLNDERVILEFDQEIEQNGTLKLTFQGDLNDKMQGFYRSTYYVNGEARTLATTQFEPTDARMALPCWDEPAVKARFEVSLIVPEDRTALSNMEEVSSTSHPTKKGKKIVKFATTPIMSTYLLAYIVGEFDYVEDHTPSGTQIRVYTQKGKSDQGKFGLEVATRCLPLFEQYFTIPYPLKKCDLVAIPDFSAGAMENWGLITYRETALLLDPVNSSASTKQYVAIVVCHELAHQWYGNLVSPQWWDNLWLNEGFATWMEYWATDQLYPEFHAFEQFVHSDFGTAQQLDAMESSHPIQVPVKRAQEVDEIFDAISYSKGCAVIRMLVNWLGMEDFRKGLIQYLNKHMYANTTERDLWNALSESSGKDVSTMMDGWIKETGYPVMIVSEDRISGGRRHLTLTQQRYLDAGMKKEDSTIWKLPISYITNKTSEPVVLLLSDRSMTIEVDEDIEWIKFNPEQTSFCRVQYPSKYYDMLIPAVESKQLSPIDRLGLQEDVCALARAGYLSSESALKILGSYRNEDNYTVWSSVASNMHRFWTVTREQPYADKFDQWARALLKRQANTLGWEPQEGESHLITLMRPLLHSQLSMYGDEETAKEAERRFELYLKESSAVVPDLRGVVYSSVIKNGGESRYNQVYDIMHKTDLNEEKLRCLRSLGASREKSLAQRTLDLSLSEEVRSQDSFYAINTVATSSVEGRDLSWEFFKKNVDRIKERFASGFLIGRIVKICTSNYVTAESADEIEQFFKDSPIPTAQRSIDQSIEKVRLHAQWITRDKDAIGQFLEQNGDQQ